PSPYHGDALPTELSGQQVRIYTGFSEEGKSAPRDLSHRTAVEHRGGYATVSNRPARNPCRRPGCYGMIPSTLPASGPRHSIIPSTVHPNTPRSLSPLSATTYLRCENA